jgi:hypothetical protein
MWFGNMTWCDVMDGWMGVCACSGGVADGNDLGLFFLLLPTHDSPCTRTLLRATPDVTRAGDTHASVVLQLELSRETIPHAHALALALARGHPHRRSDGGETPNTTELFIRRTSNRSSHEFMRPHPRIFPGQQDQGSLAEIVKGEGPYFDTARISDSRAPSPLDNIRDPDAAPRRP